MKASQRREWDRLREVMIYTPGVEIIYAQLAPEESLYEDIIHPMKARNEHVEFKKILESYVKVYDLKNTILSNKKLLTDYLVDRMSKFYSRYPKEKVVEILFLLSRKYLQLTSICSFS